MEKARKLFEAKEEDFIHNGEMLLEKQITCNRSRDIEPIKIFSAKDIQQATNNFNPNLILGAEIATFYKGTLDDREVAIKVKGPPTLWPFEMILISNGTLFDHLHGQCNEIPCQISWLDHPWTAKLSHFGFLVSIAPGEDFFQGNSIDGTIGYIYPEYLDTLRVTEKCDVYGFGVELVEVLTGHHQVEMFLGYINLVDCFVLSMEENCILQIVDDVVLSQGSNEDIQAFIELALRCIKKKGDERPSMREVKLELRRIQHLIWSKQNNETGSAQTPLKSCN
ncbi:putative wall-associated receptor kinase-like 13 [Quercus suber]|uniref:Wall-associated receptor kinase-like 13 n=2 Tax=Quercus suber TaxID=58331 RepID=A0AAW0L5V1_QUESU